MTMDPSEVEFLAEKELITITPNFTLDKLYLISGDIGPFTPAMPLEVPLWLAINLKQRQKCHVVPPEWMNVENLEEKKTEETESKIFTPAPHKHYMEVTQLVLKYAVDDIPKADEVRTLVKDIWDLRLAKLRSSIDMFVKSDNTHAKLNNLTLMEINTVRPFLTQALDQLSLLRMNLQPRGALSQ